MQQEKADDVKPKLGTRPSDLKTWDLLYVMTFELCLSVAFQMCFVREANIEVCVSETVIRIYNTLLRGFFAAEHSSVFLEWCWTSLFFQQISTVVHLKIKSQGLGRRAVRRWQLIDTEVPNHPTNFLPCNIGNLETPPQQQTTLIPRMGWCNR